MAKSAASDSSVSSPLTLKPSALKPIPPADEIEMANGAVTMLSTGEFGKGESVEIVHDSEIFEWFSCEVSGDISQLRFNQCPNLG